MIFQLHLLQKVQNKSMIVYEFYKPEILDFTFMVSGCI